MKKTVSIVAIIIAFLISTTTAFAVPDVAPAPLIKSDYPVMNGFFEDTASSTVEIAHRLFIVNGDGDGHFRPYDPITHVEFAQMCCNAFSPEPLSMDRCANPWYLPAYNWLYYQTIATVAPDIEPASMSRLFAVYLDGRSTDELENNQTLASYDHMVTMLYILRMIHSGSCLHGDVVEMAKVWATTTGIGYGPQSTNWRYVQSTDYVTREDALRLLLGLTGLGYSADLAFGPSIQVK